MVLQHLRQKMYLELTCAKVVAQPFIAKVGGEMTKLSDKSVTNLFIPSDEAVETRDFKHSFVWICPHFASFSSTFRKLTQLLDTYSKLSVHFS